MLAVVWLGACAGCAASDPPSPVTVTDSAGITLVVSSAPAWPRGSGWRLSREPLLDLGSLDEGPESFERVAGSVRLSSGTIVVADGGASQLRFFDEFGDHVRTVGRQGGGPGEFERLGLLGRGPADSLIAYDFGRRSLSWFDSAGTFVHAVRLEPHDSVRFPSPLGFRRDGGIVARGFEPAERPPEGGVIRRPYPMFRFAPDGSYLGEGPRSPGDELFVLSAGDDGFAMAIMKFGEGLRIAVGQDLITVPTHRTELTWYADGTPSVRRIARWPVPTRSVADAEWDEFIQESTGDPRMPEQFKEAYHRMPRAETMPLFGGVLVDDEGNVWLQDFVGPLDETSTMTVVAATGELLGQVEVPLGFTPLHIGADFVLGRWEDEDDIPHVLQFELLK